MHSRWQPAPAQRWGPGTSESGRSLASKLAWPKQACVLSHGIFARTSLILSLLAPASAHLACQRRDELLCVGEGVVQRRGRHADHVGLPPIADEAIAQQRGIDGLGLLR